jgi:recombination protein RecT
MTRGPSTTQNGQIQRSVPKPGGELIRFIEQHQKDLAMVLPKHLTAERMARLAISAVRTTRGLEGCSVASFASAIMACSSLGLEPGSALGHAYLIPFKGECTLVIGYKGLIDLMYRSGYVASVKAEPVFEGDEFSFEKGLEPKLRHVPCGEDDPNKLTHVYTIVRWKDGGEPLWDVLNRDQIMKRRNRSPAANARSSPWLTDFVAMSQKTGVRAIAKWAPSATERDTLSRAVAYEQAHELGRPSQAVAALGMPAMSAMDSMGAMPQDDPVPVNADGEVLDGEMVNGERQPGED